MSLNIKSLRSDTLSDFLLQNDFNVEELQGGIFRVTRDEEIAVFLSVANNTIYFEVDVCSIKDIASENLFRQLLNANTEILPISFAINDAQENDPRLVLVESREGPELDGRDVLAVFDALELAVDKAEKMLSSILSQK